jgi:hypothetical protein
LSCKTDQRFSQAKPLVLRPYGSLAEFDAPIGGTWTCDPLIRVQRVPACLDARAGLGCHDLSALSGERHSTKKVSRHHDKAHLPVDPEHPPLVVKLIRRYMSIEQSLHRSIFRRTHPAVANQSYLPRKMQL